ncbi:hypothetical protein PQQ52_19245 [Paraburkholderia sediminicola]|uniref:hypothetical protein n=1 Tax=Paraburkholderia sediminicola TaxID=458836 RepID=UPI0038B6C1CF
MPANNRPENPLTQIDRPILGDDQKDHHREYRGHHHKLYQKIHHFRLRYDCAFDPDAVVDWFASQCYTGQ